MKIVIIGAGNLATQLSLALKKSGQDILMVYSRTIESASLLGERLSVPFTDDIKVLPSEADLYIFSVKDSALLSVLEQMLPNSAIWAHTAGSVNIDLFDGFTSRGAVFYPLQTFSKNKEVDFKAIPICVEARNDYDIQLLTKLGHSISDDVRKVSSDQRKYIHLSAVFACNFTNHMFDIAYQLPCDNNLSFDILMPLIKETIQKLDHLTPRQAQTGPAVRYDKNIIDMQSDMLKDQNLKYIYMAISQNINKYFK